MNSNSFSIIPLNFPIFSQVSELVQRFTLPCTDYIAQLIYGTFFPNQHNVAKEPVLHGGIEHSAIAGRCFAGSTLFTILVLVGCGIISLKVLQRNSRQVEPASAMLNNTDKGVDDATAKVSSGSFSLETNGQRVDSKNNLKRNGDGDVDPGLLKKHSSYMSYSTPMATYPRIRTFFYPHPHINKLPSVPKPLPLLVFVHGLGGSLSQFSPLLTTLINVAPCFGIDLPGCGLSEFSPTTWSAYSIEALATLLSVAIEQHRDAAKGQEVILVAHSLGCSISALISSSESPVVSDVRKHIVGLVGICPKATPPTEFEVGISRKLLYIPNSIFDLWRKWDRRGGPDSHSVSRFVGKDADVETRKLQLRFNEQSQTAVWRRMAWGALPQYGRDGEQISGIPGKAVWSGMRCSIFLVGGESDLVTKPSEVAKLFQYFAERSENDIYSKLNWKADQTLETVKHGTMGCVSSLCATSTSTHIQNHGKPALPSEQREPVKTFVFPAPASHALLYDRSTYRALSGLIQDFFHNYIDQRLDLGWQLQHLTTSGKWDVKNLVKWQAVKPVSDPIGGLFVAMKTLREVDAKHSPKPFVEEWKGTIYAVVDISHESPVYDTAQLDKGGIQYHKLPMVSKVPPTIDEVREFVALVDHLQDQISKQTSDENDDRPHPLVGVHCHYGFNRTGFFLVSYLIERKGYAIQDALDEFERKRAPGIRHEHFIDTLFVRYSAGIL